MQKKHSGLHFRKPELCYHIQHILWNSILLLVFFSCKLFYKDIMFIIIKI